MIVLKGITDRLPRGFGSGVPAEVTMVSVLSVKLPSTSLPFSKELSIS